jgi:histone deacetylase complex regulatory component SIN3
LTNDQLWQYYVASYTMSEATEGVDQSSMRFPYLRRNIAPQSANLDTTVAEVYGNLEHFDNQTAFISPDTYKLLLSNDYIFWRTTAQSKKKYTKGKIERNEAFREKFSYNTAWMKDQRPEDVQRKKTAWERAKAEDGLYGFEEELNV